MQKSKRIVIVVLLILAIANYARLDGSGNIRTVEFLSILVIGALGGILLRDVMNISGKK